MIFLSGLTGSIRLWAQDVCPTGRKSTTASTQPTNPRLCPLL